MRRLAAVLFHKHLRARNYVLCFVLKKVDGIDYLSHLARIRPSKRVRSFVLRKEVLRHLDRHLVARPRRERNRNKRLPLFWPLLGRQPHLFYSPKPLQFFELPYRRFLIHILRGIISE